MNLEAWIKLIQALTPVIIAISEPLLKNASDQITASMIKAEKTQMNGPDKLDLVIKEVVTSNNVDTLTKNEQEDRVTKVVDMAIAAANTVARMEHFNKES